MYFIVFSRLAVTFVVTVGLVFERSSDPLTEFVRTSVTLVSVPRPELNAAKPIVWLGAKPLVLGLVPQSVFALKLSVTDVTFADDSVVLASSAVLATRASL